MESKILNKKNTLNKVKYLHILWHEDLKFNIPFVKMINHEKGYFNAMDHKFITPFETVYQVLKKYENVEIVSEGNLINQYGGDANWVFIHALNCNKISFLLTNRKYLNKIIWRTWGHDVKVRSSIQTKSIRKFLYQCLRNAYIPFYQNIIRKFYAIGVANNIDVLKVQQAFGNNIKTLSISYGYRPGQLEQFKKIYYQRIQKSYTRILVGHSGMESDNHLSLLNQLIPYTNEAVRVSLIMSYGKESYIKKVKAKAKQIFEDKVEIIENFMPYDKYAAFISNVDIALLGSKHSSALGNLTLLAYFEKKVYVHPEGDLANGIKKAGCKAYDINDVGTISFSDLKKIDVEEIIKMKKIYGNIKSSDETCADFKKVLDSLPQKT